MPLYEYECSQCHRRTEKIQKFSDPEITECPLCGGKLERTLTAPNVQFKGGGWYKDLYSSVKPPVSPAGGGESAAPPDSSGANSGSAAGSGTPSTGSSSDSSPAGASSPVPAPAAPTTSAASAPAKS